MLIYFCGDDSEGLLGSLSHISMTFPAYRRPVYSHASQVKGGGEAYLPMVLQACSWEFPGWRRHCPVLAASSSGATQLCIPSQSLWRVPLHHLFSLFVLPGSWPSISPLLPRVQLLSFSVFTSSCWICPPTPTLLACLIYFNLLFWHLPSPSGLYNECVYVFPMRMKKILRKKHLSRRCLFLQGVFIYTEVSIIWVTMAMFAIMLTFQAFI